MHGPLQAAEPEDLFVLIAPAGAAQERVFQLAAILPEIGAPYLVFDDGSARSIYPGARAYCSVPAVPEAFSALTCLLPLQLFTYHLALVAGTNPDSFRLEDPRFAAAFKQVKL